MHHLDLFLAHSATGWQAICGVHSHLSGFPLFPFTGQQSTEGVQEQGPSKIVPTLLKPQVQPHPRKPRLHLTNTGLRQELLETMQLYRVSLVDAVSASADLICPDNNLVR